MKKQSNYRLQRKRVIFAKGPIRLIDCKVRRSDGKILNKQILEHPGCVVIIPRSSRGEYILVRQYRYPIRRYLWEFPAGGRETGESFEKAAKRELMEEIGMKPRRLKKLFGFYPTPGVSAEKMHLYLAWELHPKLAEKDEDEEIEVRHFTLTELKTMISKGLIVDGKTLIGINYIMQMKNTKM